MMSPGRQKITSFFEAALPAAAHHNPAALMAAQGSVAFVVQLAGEWTLNLGGEPSDQTVHPGASLDCDLTLFFTPETFLHLLEGHAPREGHGFAYEGDPSLLKAVGKLLSAPGKGVLGFRLQAT